VRGRGGGGGRRRHSGGDGPKRVHLGETSDSVHGTFFFNLLQIIIKCDFK